MNVYLDGVYATEDIMGFVLCWNKEDTGFGEITFRKNMKTGFVDIDTEYMGKDFVEEVVKTFLDGCKYNN